MGSKTKREGKMENSVLTFVEYNIAGNMFRAYYDADGKLVFVLDSTIDARKPNVLLVINPVGDRKWDDILANDYGVDLETVRPKKDNKYQKLDIEYSGLSEYDALINAYKSGKGLDKALIALAAFREESVHRAATERLAVAEANAEKARETILRTKESIDEMQNKLRELRSKLSQQKKQVGREPTKKSASKILRTDAQIDAMNEKLHRAKKRLDNAQRRLIIADEDAEIAREILAQTKTSGGKEVTVPRPSAVITSRSASTNIALDAKDEPVMRGEIDTSQHNEYDETVEFTENIELNNNEQKAENMADEKNNDEVKPLFDKDPEILDEEIAFKPIEFGVSSPVESDNIVSEKPEIYENVIEDKPLSFTPPESKKSSAPINIKPVTDVEEHRATQESQSVLDTIKPVDMPSTGSDVRLDSELYGANNVSPIVPDAESEPVEKNKDTMLNGDSVNRPVPPAATLSGAANAVRPVSPITGNAAPTNPAPRKPTLIYYIMLILLIGLSIFTLWLYQKNTSEKTPDLTTTIPEPEVAMENNSASDIDSPFIPEIEPVTEKVVEPEPPVAEPVIIEPEPIAETETITETVEPAPVVVSEPVTPSKPVADISIETVNVAVPIEEEPAPVIPTEEEILASKPSYNVSQNEKMFVAAPDYDTETIYQETNVEAENLPTCPDGLAPDINGCCTGEVYTDMGEQGFNCCPESGGDCFPPLI